MNKSKKKSLFTRVKNNFLDWNLLFRLVLWACLCIALLILTFLLIHEKNFYTSKTYETGIALTDNGISNTYYSIAQLRDAIGRGDLTSPGVLAPAYEQMLQWSNYPNAFKIIGFSLLWFIPGTNKKLSTVTPAEAWSTRWNNITLAYSYFFITLVISFIALALILTNELKDWLSNFKNRKNGVTPYPVTTYSYSSFAMRNITEFALNLTLVFGFFNFLSTTVVLAYWMFLYIVKFVIKFTTRNKIKLNTEGFEVNKGDVYYLIGVMIFQNTYTIVRSYFLNYFGVNLDLIMQIIIPIGTVTLIVAIFIKNLMSSKISDTKKQVKTIGDTISKMRTFVTIKGDKAFNDYNFITLLPLFIKNKIDSSRSIDTQALLMQFRRYDDTVRYIEQHFTKKHMDTNYLIYCLTTKCATEKDLSIMSTNLVKIVMASDRSKKKAS